MTSKTSVAIITRHSVPNYGSFLQALATQGILESLSLSPTIIDYERSDETSNALIKQYSQEHTSPLYHIYYNTLWRCSHAYINYVLGKERKKYFHCSDLVNENTLSKVYGEFDIYLTGSDQVWNVVGSGASKEIDGAFFWDGLPSKNKIISYAASFGDSNLSVDDFKKCQAWLAKYSAISVREDSGLRLINQMGYKATQVLDPTLLINKNFWESLIKREKKRPLKQYALVYNLHSSSNMFKRIENDLQGSGLQVYSITTTLRKGLGKKVFCPSISEFLWLFKNATCVYADSFHAIAFSIIFNTPFIITLPMQYSTRLESILRLFNLEGCVFEKAKKRAWEKDRINWSTVNKLLEDEKKKSLQWLKDNVSIQ